VIRRRTRPPSPPARRCRAPLFPLAEPCYGGGPPPCFVVGVGGPGREVVKRVRSFPRLTPIALLSEADDEEAWRAATRAALRPAVGENPPTDIGRAAVVLVGAPADVAAGAAAVVERVRAGCSAERVVAVSLELPGGEPTGSAGPRLAARFKLSARYERTVLTALEVRDLAARLLAAGGAGELLRAATGRRAAGPLRLGAAAGWLPDGPVGRLLAAHLAAEVAKELCPPADRPAAEPFPLVPGIPFSPRLRAALEGEAVGMVARLKTVWRRRPIDGLDDDAHPGRERVERVVAEWVSEAAAAVRTTLVGAAREPSRFPAAVASVTRAVEQVRAERETAGEREALLADRRRRLAGPVRATDADRCAVPPGWRPWRAVRRWWMTRRTRREYRRFLAARIDELIARYEGSALAALQRELEAIAGRLAAVAARAARAGEGFARRLRPPYPNLVPLQNADTLEALLAELAVPLARSVSRPAAHEAWHRAVPRLLSGGGEDPWEAVCRQAAEVAARNPDAGRPFAELCRGLLPFHRPGVLAKVLAELAAPRRGGPDRAEARLILSATVPIVVRIRWQPEADDPRADPG
jgi:hypothetical protein